MNYIALNNDTYVLRFNGKTTRISKKQTVGFSRIVQILKEGGDKEEIIEILSEKQIKRPVRLYLSTKSNQMTAVFLNDDGYLRYLDLKSGKEYTPRANFENEPDTDFVGLYASLNSVKEEWPEYCL
ncbi:hypothetical protein BZG00_15730 [Salinivibrio kushneri]|uniref:Uncharacterized protein n=1 Tax=Salinivibrio kushneri TaxID=1908198 RepID=A0AB36JV71_9GAMM|nr:MULTISPECIES: hypothetical protein [Pseudomonadota]AGM47152.1 hypothetical protein AD45P4_00485 [Alteromonas phage vB_AmaP_AD45-P4]AGM47274.1 hypothetical protein AD45P2_00515 [Alteromonas phage vB_AmaP_AD45-P2]OOE37126.1 hypothetical protein BZG00_15730 [Salinivibrio kushneri]